MKWPSELLWTCMYTKTKAMSFLCRFNCTLYFNCALRNEMFLIAKIFSSTALHVSDIYVDTVTMASFPER